MTIQHSALQSANAQAADLERLFWVFVVIAVAVCAAVITAALWAAHRRRTPDDDPQDPTREARAIRAIVVATIASVVIAVAALVYNFSLGRTLARPSNEMLTIVLTGHQWWWEVEYDDPVPQRRVTTANEIHIPIGRPILIKLASTDVIHSLWVPSLGAKKDLIPGHQNEMWIKADRAGRFGAFCAEYCGLQHANMALDVVAESEPEFATWLERQRQPAPVPMDSLTSLGRRVFETGPCALCHNITGTLASASVGPDLTHVASRLRLASGTLSNDSASLARWIRDAQRVKPGVLMPSQTQLRPVELQALVAYLRTLK